MTRGEVWWANLPGPWGRRPVLLVARDEAYDVLTWFIVAPITTRIREISTQVILDPHVDGVPRQCAITLDALQVVHRDWLDAWITRLTSLRMSQVEDAIHSALALSR